MSETLALISPPRRLAALVLGLLAVGAACGGPTGRVKSDDEQDLTGTTRAGAETFNRLIQESVDNLLQKPSAQKSGADRLKIAFLELENRSAEELVDWRDTVRQRIDESVNRSGRYRNISDRFVRAALQETSLRPDDLYLPEKRRRFLKVLEANGNPVDFLMYASLNSGTTSAGRETQRDYLLTLELVDVETGESEKVNADVRKEYLR
ncbi:MAG: penicillin-binding protein activator LpoB [Planctomycetota bacterium]